MPTYTPQPIQRSGQVFFFWVMDLCLAARLFPRDMEYWTYKAYIRGMELNRKRGYPYGL